ncbi:MAG TPA: glycosyltransferase [Mycobacteriales bacterium]|nr:glycosyltransferase [Mycobacteriales bacterium]HWC34247.1 glycosyltransferase [Mycobacteriales bacterium]
MTSAAERPPLSVVVPTRGRPDLLDSALACLRASLADSDELVVVESGSPQPEPVWEVARRHGATLLVAAEPGVSKARNLGWQQARHDQVAFIDDDIRVRAGWAGAMARALAAHPDAAFVSGRIDLPEGQGTLSLTVKDDDDEQEFDRRSGGVIGHSANLGMHRSVLAAVGGFDEEMGPGSRWPAGEDPDLLDRVLATGAHGWYAPGAAAYHEHWRRARQYVVLQHRYGIGSGARLAKLARTDRVRFRVVLVDDVWRWGIASVGRELVKRDWLRAAGSILRVAGMLRGTVAAAFVPVRDGHFRGRAISSS